LGLSPTDIKNIEEDRLDLLPESISPQAAVRHLALLLGENPAGYESPDFNRTNSRVAITPKPIVAISKTSTSLLILLTSVIIGGFLLWRILAALAVPELLVHQPDQGLVTAQPTVTVSGRSTEQAQVFVNDLDVPLSPDGSFTTEVILSPGPNEIKIVAINSFGSQSQQNRTVIYQTP
jgi:hypothetical protein